MKNLTYNITDTKSDLAGFEPVEGNYNVNQTSSDDLDITEVEDAIAEEIAKKSGFEVGVQLFHSNGHAITSECPTSGNFLATRK